MITRKRFIILLICAIMIISTACSTKQNPTDTITRENYIENKQVKKTEKQETETKEVILEVKSESTDSSQESQTQHNVIEEQPQSIELTNTYTTKYSTVNAVTYPNFIFDYPSNWTVTKEEVTQTNETVVITNEKGINIEFSHIGGIAEGQYGGGSTTNMSRVEVAKIADSKFTPSYVQGTDHSGLGKFMVAKLKVTGYLDMLLDSDFKDVDGAVSYAVLPKSRQGTDDSVRNPDVIQFAFWYSDYISFIAYSPDGRFSAEDEKEVIEILSSFRVES